MCEGYKARFQAVPLKSSPFHSIGFGVSARILEETGDFSMDENGIKPKSVSEMLKEFADMRRAQDRANAEARRMGEPIRPTPIRVTEERSTLQETKAQSSSTALTEDEIFLTSSEAATLLGYMAKSFRNAVAAGKIPHYKLFGQNRFKKSELLKLLTRVEPK